MERVEESSRESRTQGRFVSLRRPSRTGPGTPKQAEEMSERWTAGLSASLEREGVDDVGEGVEFVGGELVIADRDKMAGDHVVESEMNFGAADVACEDHLFKLQCTGMGCCIRCWELRRRGGVEQQGELTGGRAY